MTAAIFTESYTQMEARFLLPGEVFERKSITYTLEQKPVRYNERVVLHTTAEYPDGTTRGQSMSVHARLGIQIIGRWV